MTIEEFESLNGKDVIYLICKFCNSDFSLTKSEIKRILKGVGVGKFCSRKCSSLSQRKRIVVFCTNCGIAFEKIPVEIGTNNFCSRSCSATYNNTHKKHGTRRSKLETYIEEQISLWNPDLIMLCNDKSAINSELDFYFPELRFAIELNGIFHYEPIYGNDKFEKIQSNDNQKIIRCNEAGIELCIIDTSSVGKLTTFIKEKYWILVRDLINNVLPRKNV